MENIYYRSKISYQFIKDLSNILDLQYKEYKKQIIKVILEECNNKFKIFENYNNKLNYLKNKR